MNRARSRSGALVVSTLLVLPLAALAPAPAGADPDSRPGTVAEKPRLAGVHVVDGEVRTVAQVGGSVVIGGSFTRVGPATRGAAGVVDTTAGSFAASFPDVVGSVAAALSDGAGGWYLGGTFSSVGGVARRNLAQVDASGAVTSFDPSPDGPVLDLAMAAGRLYVAGGFAAIAGGPGPGVAAFDETQSLVWRGGVTGGAVRALAVSGDGARVFVGGDFSQIGGVVTRRLGALNADGTTASGFAPGVVNLPVNDLVVKADGQLLMVGEFTRVNTITRNRIAQVDAVTGDLGPLDVSVNNVISDVELDAATDTAYIAGTFGQVGGVSRNRLAGVNLAGSGSVTTLSLSAISGNAASVTLDGAGGLYLGGSFQINPERDNPAVLARVALDTQAVTEVVPYYETPRSLARAPVSGTSGALVLVRQGSNLLVAGDFSDYGTVARRGLAAYDVATGALHMDFDPSPDGPVNTVKSAADGQAVFVGGEFQSIAGQPSSRIAKLDIATGQNVSGFAASADSFVKDMQVRTDGQTVYVGGNFASFNGAPASRLVAIDAHSGATLASFSLPLTEPTNDMSEGGLRAMALSPDETRLMVIGNFRKIGGLDRPLVAQVDVSGPTAAVTDWRTELYDQPCARSGKVGFMRDVDISPDGSTVYIVSAGHFYYPACDSLNSLPMSPGEPGSDVLPHWTKKIGDTLEAVAADRDAVYIGGHFRYLETETRTQPRFQIAAVDPATGEGLSWDPNAGGFRGVLALELEPAGLLAASDGDTFGVVKHGRNAFWPNPAPGIEVRKEPSRPWVLAPSGAVTHKVRVHNTFTDRSVTLSALSDQRMGDLAGSGTCALPQTLGPGQMYSCTTASETVSGAAATAVTSTVTATATDGTVTVSDTDLSTVQLIATAPVFRLRGVVGPGTVSYPGQTVRFSLTMMNLDLERPATLTQLTSPTFGNLSSECGLPVVVGPNRLLNCHVDRFVTGSVGSRPSFSFTASAQYDTGTLTSTSSQSVTINPPVGGTRLLAVVANPAALSGPDAYLTNRLDNNYAITYADDDTVQPADVLSDHSFVVLYPSALPGRLGTRLRGLDRPVLLTHSRMLDEMGMTAVGANGSFSGTQFTFVTSMHPLSTARSGTVTAYSTLRTIGYGTPEPSATTITGVAAGATEFVYAEGAAMTTGAAPSCRLFIGVNNPTRLTTIGRALFDRAAAYTSQDCGRNMLWTAVGNGQSSYGTGDGRQSVTVGLNTPWGIVVDSQDRVYIADAGTHAVRRVNTDGTVVTIAGTGAAGSSGDGGQATSARLNAPVRLAFDSAGNLYIADSGNHRIRRVTPGGIISTVAGTGAAGSTGDGGPATAARLRTPYDVAFGPDGSMYIADRGNNRVRRVSVDGVISTFAGTGAAGYNGDDIAATSARLSSPYSVDVDADGNVYVADFDNERVRVVDTGGVIRTFAGTGVATAEGDGGLATEAGLHKPQYVLVTPDGDLYIGESNNNRVRLVHDGTIDTLAGSGQFGYLGDGGFPLFSTWSRPSALAFDAQGDLWVVDRGNRRVRVINAS